MKIRIVVAYEPRYRRGHAVQFVPPVTGIHLAALVPPGHDVEVVHEQVRAVPIDDDVDLVALSFFSGFARHGYAIADAYRALGVPVVVGGPHASYWPDDTLLHADAVVVGEAESVIAEVVADADRGALRRVYRGEARSLAGLPTPRYDLVERRFVVRRVVQATRGCPFACRFCAVPDLNPGFRTRPVDEVLRDVASTPGRLPLRDKLVWFWDDNLLGDRRYAASLLDGLAGLDRWWLTQASMDIASDRPLLDRMERSGCAGIFLGIESFAAADLRSVAKRPNRISAYRDAVRRLHDRGICVMAGFIAGFDGQTPEDVVAMADHLRALEIDVPFLSILTPYRGTPLYDDLLAEGRLLEERDWPHYNGYNVAFRPARMTPEALLAAHRTLWTRAFSPRATLERLLRGARQLSPGGLVLSGAMNAFYGWKGATGNLPTEAEDVRRGAIPHAPGQILTRSGSSSAGTACP